MVKVDSVQESLRLIQSEIRLLNFVHRHQTLNAAHDSTPHAKQHEAMYAQAIPPPPPPTHVARAQAALLARRTGARPAQAFTPSAQDDVTSQWSSGSTTTSIAAAPHTTTTKATPPSFRRTVQLRLDGLV